MPNGLRLLLLPDNTTPVVGVSVHYDVGFRSEPEGQPGLAHLFEHLMFQGSESLNKLEHFRQVQGTGGSFNATTHPDYTDFFAVVPSAALERVLFLEADRMRAPRITEESLANQVAVIREEILHKVDGQPYGGIPWIHLPQAMYSSFANTHNGYGAVAELERIGLDDCASFFETYYSPTNAVLTVAGDIEQKHVPELVERHFADIPARDGPGHGPVAEPVPEGERRAVHRDPLAPFPALVVGYRLPDPAKDLRSYLAYIALSSLLCGGSNSRLHDRLVREESAIAAESACGLFGTPLDARDPDTMTIVVTHPQTVSSARLLAVIDEEVERLSSPGPGSHEMDHMSKRWRARLHREHDGPGTRMRRTGATELLYGRGELPFELPDLISAVTAEEVAVAAGAMRPDVRTVLLVEPGPRSPG